MEFTSGWQWDTVPQVEQYPLKDNPKHACTPPQGKDVLELPNLLISAVSSTIISFLIANLIFAVLWRDHFKKRP